MGGVEMIGFEAETTIKRSDFGVDMGIPMVSDEVKLDIAAAFIK
jgi:polyisoprenoid-binding protein YceI